MSLLNDYRVLWRVAVVQRGASRVLMLILWVAVLLALLCLLLGAVFKFGWGRAASVAVVIPGACFLLVWLFVFVPGAVIMNTPANARLVPRMHRRLVEMIVGGWAVVFLVTLVCAGWRLAPLVTFWAVAMSIGRSGRRIGRLFGAMAGFMPVLSEAAPSWVIGFIMSGPGFACVTVLLLLSGTYAISIILPGGGEHHAMQHKHQVKEIGRLESMGRDRSQPNTARSLYAWVLRRAIALRKADGLLLHCLGPRMHWTSILPAFAGLLAIVLAIRALFPSLAGGGFAAMNTWWAFLNVLLLWYFSFVDQSRQIGATRSEQALFRLAARSPAAHELNQRFARQLVFNVLMCWFAVSALIMGLSALAGTPPRLLLVQGALCSLACLPGVAWVLRDFARAEPGHSLFPYLAMLTFVVVVPACALALREPFAAQAWIGLAVAVNAAGGVAAFRRWKKLVAAPVAFPAGRLA